MFKNDFMKWHLSFMIPYTLTYIVGLFRGSSSLAYQLHPLLGIASVVVPLGVYLLLPNKKLIRQMIKSNFNLRGKPLMKVAKVSTQFIFVYFVFSALSGFLLQNGLYGTAGAYQILSVVHSVAKIIVPVAVITHVAARLTLKRS